MKKSRAVTLTESRFRAYEELLQRGWYAAGQAAFMTCRMWRWCIMSTPALKAHKLFTSERDYIVKDNKVDHH
jgi:preprotein translocase subunit SecA